MSGVESRLSIRPRSLVSKGAWELGGQTAVKRGADGCSASGYDTGDDKQRGIGSETNGNYTNTDE